MERRALTASSRGACGPGTRAVEGEGGGAAAAATAVASGSGRARTVTSGTTYLWRPALATRAALTALHGVEHVSRDGDRRPGARKAGRMVKEALRLKGRE